MIIYLVDDDPKSSVIQQEIISESFPGAELHTFEVATEAMKKLESNLDEAPDFILLDINMPVMNAWDFLMEYVEKGIHTLVPAQIVLLSPSHDRSEISKAEQYRPPVMNYAVKPLSVDWLQSNLVLN